MLSWREVSGGDALDIPFPAQFHALLHSPMKAPILFLVTSLLVLAGCSGDMLTDIDISQQKEEEVNTGTFRTGSWEPLNGKKTMGTVNLQTLDDGMLQVAFSEDFSLSDGPGLFVYLSNGEVPSTDFINLGNFISPTGAQFYRIPDDVTLDSYTHVLVHCEPYNVTFAYAALR